jgi:hypothetical protein
MDSTYLVNGEEHIDEGDDASSEEEGVGLYIADLEESEAEAEKPDCRGTSLNKDSIDEPAVDEGAETGKAALDGRHGPVIEGIDVEAIGK